MKGQKPLQDVFKCPHCSTEYAITYQRTKNRDSGSAYCKVCRKKMCEWNAFAQPTFTPLDSKLREQW